MTLPPLPANLEPNAETCAAFWAMTVPLVAAAPRPVVDRPRPLVAVKHPTIPGPTEYGESVGAEEVPEALVLTCSGCGDLTDWESIAARQDLQRRAARHAAEVHDGDVDAEGWAR